MPKLLKIVLGVVLVLGISLLILDFTYSRQFEKRVSLLIEAPSLDIYALVASPKTWLDWSPWNQQRDPSCVHEFSGPERGKGALWKWRDGEELGTGTFSLIEADPKTGIRYRVEMEGYAPFDGEIAFAAKKTGTELTWTSKGEMPGTLGLGVLMFVADMTGMMEAEYTTGLKSLAAHVTKRAAKTGGPVEATHHKQAGK